MVDGEGRREKRGRRRGRGEGRSVGEGGDGDRTEGGMGEAGTWKMAWYEYCSQHFDDAGQMKMTSVSVWQRKGRMGNWVKHIKMEVDQ